MTIKSITLQVLALLGLITSAWADECWLCRRASPPNPLSAVRYTEAGTVSHQVCAPCKKDKPDCTICQGPTTAKQEVDGRFICPECKKVAIDTPQEVETLYADVRRFVESTTGAKVDQSPPILLVMSDEMDTKFAEGSGRSMRAHAFYQPYNPEQIYVLSGHSAYDLGPTLAHEFTHAWQSRHCPSQDRMVKEGFATWMGYKYAESKRYTGKANEMLSRTDPDYGGGLKKCLALEKKSGIKGLVEWMRKNSQWPKG